MIDDDLVASEKKKELGYGHRLLDLGKELSDLIDGWRGLHQCSSLGRSDH